MNNQQYKELQESALILAIVGQIISAVVFIVAISNNYEYFTFYFFTIAFSFMVLFFSQLIIERKNLNYMRNYNENKIKKLKSL